ncbi:hypothetical protein D3C81_1120910 [compost metagenome]
MPGRQHQYPLRQILQRLHRWCSGLPEKDPSCTAERMTEIEKRLAFVIHRQGRTQIRSAAFQMGQHLIGGKRLLVNELQPRHVTDALEQVTVQARPLAMFILEQVQRVFQRRDHNPRMLGHPLQLLVIQHDH